MQEGQAVRIKALWHYPVKSMQGIPLTRASAKVTGFPQDRQFMVVDASGGFISQRQRPKMAVIQPSLSQTHLKLTVAGKDEISITLAPALANGQKQAVRVFESECVGIDLGGDISAWLTEVLGEGPDGKPLRLMCFDPKTPRPVSKTHLKGEDSYTLFADGYPYLVTSEATLAQVNDALADKGLDVVPMSRFRPNIVVDGTTAFDEFQWEALAFEQAGVRFGLRKPCQRCEIVTVEQSTGEILKKGQPLGTLVKINPLKAAGKKGGYFGVNATLVSGVDGELSVGDILKIVRPNGH